MVAGRPLLSTLPAELYDIIFEESFRLYVLSDINVQSTVSHKR
jgi:hypothetical protein